MAEIQAVPMQDATTGAFKPQEDSYLNGSGGPSQALLAAFMSAASALLAAPEDGVDAPADGVAGWRPMVEPRRRGST